MSDPARPSHELKTWAPFFGAVLDGTKPFELRFNDRDFAVSDELHLREYDPTTHTYSGRETRRRISYVLHADMMGLSRGYVILGLADAALLAHRAQLVEALRTYGQHRQACHKVRCKVCGLTMMGGNHDGYLSFGHAYQWGDCTCGFDAVLASGEKETP